MVPIIPPTSPDDTSPDGPTPDREQEIRTREQAATPGPWEEYPDYGKDFYAYLGGSHLRGVGTLNFGDGEDAAADRAFTLNAREDVPWLLAEVDRLRARVAELETAAHCQSQMTTWGDTSQCVLPVRHRGDHRNAENNHFWSDEYADGAPRDPRPGAEAARRIVRDRREITS
ncbi:MAG: hypothetical protein HOZ81_47475 [Streptomyces sp.]|nr:hypothetical protein [Streptomyces sp.]